ncbi:MAG: apolipoprotein N-acyltransferase [Salinispira sp.]
MNSFRQIIVLVFLAALCNFLAQPNELFLGGNWFFGIFSFIPLYILALRYTKRQNVFAGYVYALLTTLSNYFWLANFGDYSLWTIGSVSILNMIFHGAFFSLVHYLIGSSEFRPAHGHGRLQDRWHDQWQWQDRWLRPLLFAMAWTAFEFFKSRGYLAFPWNLAAFPFHNWLTLNQIGELAGIWPISFVIFLLQSSIAELISSMNNRPSKNRLHEPALRYVLCAAAILLAFNLYGFFRLNNVRLEQGEGENEEPVIVLLVQQNADSWSRGEEISALQTLIGLSNDGIDESLRTYGRVPDIVSWSETSLRYPYNPNNAFFAENPPGISFREYLAGSNTDLITGAPIVRSERVYMNGVIHLDSGGNALGDYGKIHLIPFAEHIPLTNLPLFANFLENTIGLYPSGWTPGEGIRTFHFADSKLRIGTPVCFEDSFATNARAFAQDGADLLLNLTNNSWSRTQSAQYQHFVAARYRAIETRRPLLRATNSGLTSIIMPDGSIHNHIPMFEPAYLLAEIHVNRNAGISFYTRYGDWFAWLVGAGMVLVLIKRVLPVTARRTGHPAAG